MADAAENDALGKTVDKNALMATLASIVRLGDTHEIPPARDETSQTSATNTASRAPAAVDPKRGTVANAVVAAPAADADHADNWSSDEFKTLDSNARFPTVDNQDAGNRTVDISNPGGKAATPAAQPTDSDPMKTVDLTSGKATVELSTPVAPPQEKGSDAWSSDEFRTMDSSPKLPTVGRAEAVGDIEQNVSRMWKGAATHGGGEHLTIKAGGSGMGAESALVVRARTFRDSKDTDASAADYELLNVIGEGGMGVVYAARQGSIDRTVAIKMLHADAAADIEQRAKFLSEAVVTGDLDHPNIVPIHDLGTNEAGALFYSMKRVQGTPWIKVIRKKSLAENLEILLKVADAVAFAHARGVIHRDLKPENTMLGDFGEVLVMDWGLALSTATFSKRGSIHQTSSMGGTPAYMAPEMATGPIERVGPLADVYLLGAMLYEIVTGKPPHTGKNVMACLFAAAKNEIQKAPQTSELVDVALVAMATSPADRYQTVQAFQTAIREYQSHSESVSLSTRADSDLEEAERTDDYQRFSRALFAFQEALAMWDGNTRARAGVDEAKLAYARSAMRKRDYDLGLSLVDAQEPSHAELHAELSSAKRDQEARLQRLSIFKRLAVGLVATIFLVVSVAMLQVRAQRDRARRAEESAMTDRDRAVVAEKEAMRAADLAATERDKALVAEESAIRESDRARDAERQARVAAEAEKLAKEAEEYESYIARIGLAAAKIDENAYGSAAEILADCRPDLRHWEWGRLMHLCTQSVQQFRCQGPVDTVAFANDGKTIATGSWDGKARVWDIATGETLAEIPHDGLYVHAVAFSNDGKLLATGSNDPQGFVRVCDARTGALVRKFAGHQDAVLSVVFSRDGKRLLTASYDNTARLWDVATGDELMKFVGHTWWVWDAAFSDDEKRIVTASQDGTALVWNVDSGRHGPPFSEHQGPVYSAAFSRDGARVATAGYDKRALVWRPDDLKPFEYERLVEGQSREPVPYLALEGHTAAVRSVVFSDDDGRVLTGSHDNTVRLWDARLGKLVKSFRGHAGWVRSCAFAPHGAYILSGGHDYEAMLWNIEGYEEVRVLQGRVLAGHTDAVLAAAFSPDDSQLLTASRDRTAKLWDMESGREVRTFDEGHNFLASSVAVSNDETRLYTAAVDNVVCAWDVAAGTELFRLDRTGRDAAFALSRDGTRIVTGSDNRSIKLWDAADGRLIREFGGLKADATAVAISRDCALIVSGEGHGLCRVWNVESGGEVARFDHHSAKVVAVDILADGHTILTASADNTVANWDARTGQERLELVLKHPNAVTSMSVADDGRLAVTACSDGRARVWEVATARMLGELVSGDEQVASVAIARDGSRVLTTSPEARRVRLWDAATLKPIDSDAAEGADREAALLDFGRLGGLVWTAVFSPSAEHVATVGGNDARLWDAASGREQMTFSAHGAVASANFSHDGARVVTASWDNSAKIWDTATGRGLRKLAGAHQGYVNTAVFSRDDQFVLTASDDHTAKIWDAEAGTVVRTLSGHSDRVRSAVYSADGTRILTTSSDKTARIWDAATGEPLLVLKGHAWGVLCGAFSRDGKLVITGAEDNQARIWDARDGRPLVTLSGHTASVSSVTFSIDGRRALTGSQDNSVKLWDAATAKEVLTLPGHTQEVTSVAFSNDGRYVVSAGRDGTAIVWLAIDWRDQVQVAKAVGSINGR